MQHGTANGRLLVCSMIALAACHSTIVLEAPPSSVGKSIVVVISGQDEQLVVAADTSSAAGGFAPALPSITPVDELEMSAAYYACTLDELGLDAGRVTLVDDRDPLVDPRATMTWDGDTWRSSTVTEALDGALRRLGWGDRCDFAPELEFRGLVPLFDPIVATEDLTFVVPFEGDEILVGTTSNRFLRVTARGDVTVQTATVPGMAGFRFADGRFGFVEQSGRVHVATRETVLDPTRWQTIEASLSVTSKELFVAPRPLSGAVELFALTSSGTAEWFDGRMWSKKLDFGPPAGRLQVTWQDANEARAIGIGPADAIVRVQIGSNVEVTWSRHAGVDDLCSVDSIAYVPELGWTYGTCGSILIEDGAVDVAVAGAVRFIAPYAARSFVAAGGEAFTLYHQGGECVPETGVEPLSLRRLVPVESGYLWVGEQPPSMRLLEWRPPKKTRPACLDDGERS